jgi:excisionase family DNA binding protein
MDTTIANLFSQYQDLTGSADAAAALVLADVTLGQRTKHTTASGEVPGHLTVRQGIDGLVDLTTAAAYLGYIPSGLRKLVKQKRIRYVQNGRGPIRFRREWLDEFINANSSGPQDIERAPAQTRSKPRPASKPRLSYDSSFYLR